MPDRRKGVAVARYGDLIFAIGGKWIAPSPSHTTPPDVDGGGRPSPTQHLRLSQMVYIYSIRRNEWRRGPQLNQPRAYASAFISGFELHVVGGTFLPTRGAASVEKVRVDHLATACA